MSNDGIATFMVLFYTAVSICLAYAVAERAQGLRTALSVANWSHSPRAVIGFL